MKITKKQLVKLSYGISIWTYSLENTCACLLFTLHYSNLTEISDPIAQEYNRWQFVISSNDIMYCDILLVDYTPDLISATICKY